MLHYHHKHRGSILKRVYSDSEVRCRRTTTTPTYAPTYLYTYLCLPPAHANVVRNKATNIQGVQCSSAVRAARFDRPTPKLVGSSTGSRNTLESYERQSKLASMNASISNKKNPPANPTIRRDREEFNLRNGGVRGL